MLLRSPKNLHYPITVTELLQQPHDDVERFAPLFSYSYKSTVTEGNEFGEVFQVEKDWYSKFESEVDGTLVTWKIKKGTVIASSGAELAVINEPCRHEIQFGGMCAECGKDMTTVAYNTSTRDTDRATINMAHGNTALRISQNEATKAEDEAKRRLLASKKLSLVVDLDQTIIHATVDPTVAEWQQDPDNPNYEAVKDVRAFQLVDDGPGARGCWYYIKLRPGLQQFLENISQLYELHIYTMGTRAYAKNIAKIVDPDRKIFGDRILSRDESGSLTAKNLQRLFPVDTKMVVIIDDRGDVWHWSANLIKVSAYDFFVGIGDINSSFLPKRPELEARPPIKAAKVAESPATFEPTDGPPIAAAESATKADATQLITPPQSPPQTNGDVSALHQLVSMGGGDDLKKLKEQTTQQGEAIAAQLEDRPLLQKQKKLDAAEEEANQAFSQEEPDGGNKDDTHNDLHRHRHNLLQDDDTELEHLERSLREVHHAFFDEYDKKLAGPKGSRVAELKGDRSAKKRSADELEIVPDVKVIMPNMKQRVLAGVEIVFSGVVPLGIHPQNSDIALWAKSFGARVSESVNKKTTHVVATPIRRTAKVRQAAKHRNRIKIVDVRWLHDSFTRWKRLNEEPYRIHHEAEENGQTAGDRSIFDVADDPAMLSSSDEEAAVTEDENEKPGLEIDTVTPGELEKLMPSEPQDDDSPIGGTNEDWQGMNDELAEFMGSEADSDSDSESDGDSVKSNTSNQTTESIPRRKKRKRDGESAESIEAEDSDTSTSSLKGSRLQKRKKRAIDRTTSLTNMATTDKSSSLPSPDTTGADDDEEREDGGATTDDDDAALEAELEAAFEEASDEED
ncbi:hypothetical protein B0A49_12118 [Cryomyces minteri]|uniref:RNA polymerase II subunit A C-terminal domain phosphatase n=1 Tax=Cryomyces minteri TaxID=331657 RepID=A0A4U0VMI4_9PEZI|nr:hypothetical protein B0A49_12118 [Cryomyces minteri]